jgi:hypothetical protein
VSANCITSLYIWKKKHMIILFFNKHHKYVDPVNDRSRSRSSKGAVDVRNAFKVYFNGPTAAVLPQNYESRFICAWFSLEHHVMEHGVYKVYDKLILISRVKGKGYRITGHQEAQRGSRSIALLILDLGARSGWVVSTAPRPLYPQEKPGTHCTKGWVGPRVSLDVYVKSRSHRDSIRGQSSL